MVTCCENCCPHCDFCIWAEYYYLSLNGERIRQGVESCKLHPDDHHQWLARAILNIAKTFIVIKRTQKRSENSSFLIFLKFYDIIYL